MLFLSNKAIIEGCLRKDQKCWSFFVDRFSKVIYWAINERLARWKFNFSQHDVDDIFQEVFLELWQKNKLSQIKDEKNISGWLAMVAGNYAINYIQRKGLMPNKQWVDIKDVMLYSQSNPAKEADINNLREILTQAISILSEKEKIAINLRLVMEKKYAEIAKIMNLPLKTVFSIVNRAKVKIKQELQKRGLPDACLPARLSAKPRARQGKAGITNFEEKW